jgi:hypothetical protein
MELLTIEGLKTVFNEKTTDLFYFSEEMLNDGIYIKYKVLQPMGIPGPKGLKHSHFQVGNLKVTGNIVSIAEYFILYWDVQLSYTELYRMIKDTYEIFTTHSRSEFGEFLRERAKSGAISPTPKKLEDSDSIINDLLHDMAVIKELAGLDASIDVPSTPNAPINKELVNKETNFAVKAESHVDITTSQGRTFTKIIKDGRLTIPLYHGTSTLFLDGILEEGLGAVSPIEKYGIMEFLAKLVHKGKEYMEYLPKSEQFRIKQHSDIVHQAVANFRYGGLFLSASKVKAIRYSMKKYGSELITITIEFYLFLKKYSVPVELDNDFLNQILDNTYDPVVIIASEVDSSLLQSENNNKPVDDSFELLQFCLEQDIDPQVNFELPKSNIITPELLTVMSVAEYNNIKEENKYLFG